MIFLPGAGRGTTKRWRGTGVAKIIYCWRCDAEMPMLGEDEYLAVFRVVKREGILNGQAAALDMYEELTGLRETNLNAIWHHRVSLYGPPCKSCGKPLRTPKASFCAACGTIKVP